MSPLAHAISVDSLRAHYRTMARAWLQVALISFPVAVAAQVLYWQFDREDLGLLRAFELLTLFGGGLCGFIGGLMLWKRLRSLEPSAPLRLEVSSELLTLTVGSEPPWASAPVLAVYFLPQWVSFELATQGQRRHVDVPLTELQRGEVRALLPNQLRTRRLGPMFLFTRVLGIARLELAVRLFTIAVVTALTVLVLQLVLWLAGR